MIVRTRTALYPKRTSLVKLATAVLLLCASAGCASGQATIAPRQDYVRVAAALEQFIEHEMRDKQLPALSIALVDDQQIVWVRGFGFADPERKVPATAETVYRIGSVSKLFTDIGVMQLVESGKLDLDAPITKYLLDFQPKNPFGKPITLRQLMSHRAGLLREPPVGHYFDPTEPSLADTVHSLNGEDLVYAPESRIKYSNAGIATVGYVLERMANQPFAKYLKQAVLKPMGLKASAFEPEPGLVRNLAKAYMWTYDGRVFAAPTFQLGESPAGSMYSTVTDLARFLAVLFAGGHGPDGTALKPESLEEMWRPQFAKPGEKRGFGIGFRLSELEGHRLVGHGGAIYGFATELEALPDEKLGAIAVITMDSANGLVTHIANEALRLMLAARRGKPLPSIPMTTPVAPELARKLAGRYGEGEKAIDLVEQNGLSLVPVRGGYQVSLRQLGDALIVDDRLAYGTKMFPVADGIRINGETLKRTQVSKPAPTPEDWKGLIGEYGWDYDILYILQRDGHLTSLIEWYEYERLEQLSRNVFKYPARGLYDGEKLVFTRDGNGRATEVRVGGVIFKRRTSTDGDSGGRQQ